MQLNPLLQPISEKLLTTLPDGTRAVFTGRVEPQYDPSIKGLKLVRVEENNAPFQLSFTPDVQVIYRHNGTLPNRAGNMYGTKKDVKFDVTVTLACACRNPELLPEFLMALETLSRVIVLSVSTNTLQVLKEQFLYVPSDKTPYDPTLQAFAITLSLLGVSKTIFSQAIESQA
ncbi:hypothetical protein GCM10023189_43230 [Nibrella saemangeumensis]|uniref:Uncharacterized protein n=1 Tax=Nibrella saemangeumensis TaxID=1084526 RepID=A0ABP8NCR4_9BACT